jgi:hypothetical protein
VACHEQLTHQYVTGAYQGRQERAGKQCAVARIFVKGVTKAPPEFVEPDKDSTGGVVPGNNRPPTGTMPAITSPGTSDQLGRSSAGQRSHGTDSFRV